jgi:phthalate 4,5-dioxygenase reductase component
LIPVSEGGTQEDGVMMPLRVTRKTRIATDVFLFELVRPDAADLPPFRAGAHVTVLTPNGLTRRYSLCNDPAETHRYCLAIKREPQGLGGSANIVDAVQVGDELPTSLPLNYFPLQASAAFHLLIAGGIGITPILSMVRELKTRGSDFQVVYLTRDAESTAFRDELLDGELRSRVLLHHDGGDLARALDLTPWLANRREDAHLYCCGPRGLMHAVREQTRHWPGGSVHFEDFGGSEPQPQLGEDRPFTVKLARSGRTVAVPAGVSILEALRREDLPVPSSCESGTCGTCRTGLLAGVAEHRDYVLDEDEQHEIMICVSRAISPVLELDL